MNSSAYSSSEDECTDSKEESLSERDDEGESCIEGESCVNERVGCTYEESVDERVSCNDRENIDEGESCWIDIDSVSEVDSDDEW